MPVPEVAPECDLKSYIGLVLNGAAAASLPKRLALRISDCRSLQRFQAGRSRRKASLDPTWTHHGRFRSMGWTLLFFLPLIRLLFRTLLAQDQGVFVTAMSDAPFP